MRNPSNQRPKLTATTVSVLGFLFMVIALVLPPLLQHVVERMRSASQLSDVKGIALACKLYATDRNGKYPFYSDPLERTGPARNSNEAFQLLIPKYMPTEMPFYVRNSAWSDHFPDEKPPLTKGENHWAYFGGLTDTSNPDYPLIAEGFVEGSEANTIYSFNLARKGGVKGKHVIVIQTDTSGSIRPVRSDGVVTRLDSSAKNLFLPEKGGWLDGVAVLNPK